MSFKLRASGGNAAPPDFIQVRRALSVFIDPEHYVFLQSLPDAAWKCLPGSEPTQIEEWIAAHAAGNGFYFGINPIVKIDRPSRVGDVVKRRWILIDVDRNKTHEPDNPATENEHEDAKELAFEIHTYLTEIGFPIPVQIDSGNGFHLYYRIDMPNDPEHRNLIHAFLKILDNTFSGEKGKIDHTVCDARRVSKLPGTWSRRGATSAQRPYRMCQFVYHPKEMEVLTVELLRRVVDDHAKHEEHSNGALNGKHPDVPANTGGFGIKAAGDADRDKLYGQKAIEQEQALLAGCPPGGRHNQLVKSAYNLWELHFGGCLEAHEVKDVLFVAACNCGLDKDAEYGEKKIIRTIDDCREKAKGNPRNATGQADTPQRSQKPENSDGNVNWKIQLDDTTIVEGSPSFFDVKVDDPGKQDRVFAMYTIGGLIAKDFPEPKWIVPGMMSEGLNLLAGKPKQGKSMLALNLALTIAAGGKALGETQTGIGDVLYLSLEDKARRVKARAINMLKKIGSKEAAYRLTIATEWPRQHEGGLAMLEHWYRRVERPVLLILDVWGMFKTPYARGGSQYEQDGQQLGAVKRFVDQRGMSALVLLHCRKGPSEDVLEEVSGTMGLTGVADGIIVLNRMRNDTEAKIFITGRDVPEKELALEFDKETFTWRSLGTMDEHVDGKLQGAVMGYMKAQRGMIVFAKQICDALDIPSGSVRKTLHRLQEKGFICQRGNGWSYPNEGVQDGGEVDY